MSESKSAVRERMRQVLLTLTEQERKLLTEVLRIEKDYLHQKQPQLRDELLRAVRQTIKEIPQ